MAVVLETQERTWAQLNLSDFRHVGKVICPQQLAVPWACADVVMDYVLGDACVCSRCIL